MCQFFLFHSLKIFEREKSSPRKKKKKNRVTCVRTGLCIDSFIFLTQQNKNRQINPPQHPRVLFKIISTHIWKNRKYDIHGFVVMLIHSNLFLFLPYFHNKTFLGKKKIGSDFFSSATLFCVTDDQKNSKKNSPVFWWVTYEGDFLKATFFFSIFEKKKWP